MDKVVNKDFWQPRWIIMTSFEQHAHGDEAL